MAQTDAPPAEPAPKLNPKTLIIGLLIALAGGGSYAGVDAAGYAPDTKLLEALGIGGAILLIGYLHLVWLPLFRQKGATLDKVGARVEEAHSKLDDILKRLTTVSLVLLIVLMACGPSARQQTLRTMYTGATTAQAGFVAWDKEKMLSLSREATTLEDLQVKIAKYKEARSPVVDAFEVVYRGLAAAALLDEDQASLVSAVGAFEQLRLALRTLTGGKLP